MRHFSLSQAIKGKQGFAAINGDAGHSYQYTYFIESNDPVRSNWKIQLNVTRVIEGIEIVPGAISFGQILHGKLSQKVVNIIDLSGKARKPKNIFCNGQSGVVVRLVDTQPSAWDGPGGGDLVCIILVELQSDSLGEIIEDVIVHFDNSDRPIAYKIPVSARIVPEVQCYPSNIAIPALSVGRKIYNAKVIFESQLDEAMKLDVLQIPEFCMIEFLNRDQVGRTHMALVTIDLKSHGSDLIGKDHKIHLKATIRGIEYPLSIDLIMPKE